MTNSNYDVILNIITIFNSLRLFFFLILIFRNISASLPYNLPSFTPDDDVFRHLSKIYANTHPTMHLGDSCDSSTRFEGGIVNGAAWYPLRGT